MPNNTNKINAFFELKRDILDLVQVLLHDHMDKTDNFKVKDIDKAFNKVQKILLEDQD